MNSQNQIKPFSYRNHQQEIGRNYFQPERRYSVLVMFLVTIAWVVTACGGAAPMEEVAKEGEPGEAEPQPIATEIAQSEPVEPQEEMGEEAEDFPREEMPMVTMTPPLEMDPEPTTIATPQTLSLVPESRLLTFEWPSEIRVGDSDVLRISLVMDEEGNLTPTAVFADHEVQGQNVLIENLYDTHFVRVEARLDLAGIEVLPAGIIDQSLAPGEPVEFNWSIRPTSTGTFRGSVWLNLRYLPKGDGEPLEKLLYNQLFEIRAVNLLGFGGTPARILGAIGSVIGSLLGLDDILSWLRVLRKKRSFEA